MGFTGYTMDDVPFDGADDSDYEDDWDFDEEWYDEDLYDWEDQCIYSHEPWQAQYDEE